MLYYPTNDRTGREYGDIDMDKKLKFARYVFCALLVCLLAAGALKALSLDSTATIQADIQITFLNEEGRIRETLSEGLDSVCIYTIPKEDRRNLVLAVESYMESFQVSLDGEMIFSYSDEGREKGVNIQWIDLPEDTAGKELQVKWVNSPSANSTPSIYLGTSNSLFLHYIEKAFPAPLFGGLYIVFGLMVIALQLFLCRKGNYFNQKALLPLGSFILLTGLWTLSDSNILQLVTGKTALITFISFLSFTAMPLVFLLFFQNILNRPRKSIAILSCIQIIHLCFVSFCYLTGILDFYATLPATHLLLAVTVIRIVSAAVSEYKKNRNSELRKFLAGISLLMFFIILAMLSFYRQLSGQRYSLYYSIGLFLFILCLIGAFLDHIYKEMQENARTEAYKKLAYTDLMTGMKNRSAFKTDIQDNGSRLLEKNYTCVIFDVNHLKETNDTYGHAQGDALIIDSASCIMKCFSSDGSCYRTGGDEFVVLLENFSEESLLEKLDSLDLMIAELNKTRTPALSIAYGYSRKTIFSLAVLHDLYEEADRNMYKKKTEMKKA